MIQDFSLDFISSFLELLIINNFRISRTQFQNFWNLNKFSKTFSTLFCILKLNFIKSKNILRKNSQFLINHQNFRSFPNFNFPPKRNSNSKEYPTLSPLDFPSWRARIIEEISLRGWGSVRDKLKFFANEPVLLDCEYLSSFEPATLYPILLARFTLHAPRDSRYLLRASDAP